MYKTVEVILCGLILALIGCVLSSCAQHRYQADSNRLVMAGGTAGPSYAQTKAQLDATFTWLMDNPPLSWDGNTRMPHFAAIDAAAWTFTAGEWEDYRAAWDNPSQADQMENDYPILHYFRNAIDNAINEILTTTVTQGAVLWHMYNMGIVVKTPTNTFACDVNFRGAERLVDLLDFASVSHEHEDHNQESFLNAMVNAGKPVYSPHWNKGTIINGGEEIAIGELQVKFRMSDQQGGVDCIIAQVDCGPSANNYNVCHSGDATHPVHFVSDVPVDVFVIHSNIGINMQEATANIQPDILLLSHYMELWHPVGAARWAYVADGLANVADYNENTPHGNKAICMTWGERLGLQNVAAGLPASLELTADPGAIPDDGSTATVTATVKELIGNLIPGGPESGSPGRGFTLIPRFDQEPLADLTKERGDR